MKMIPVSQNHVAMVDDEDYTRLQKYSWFYHGNGYAARGYHKDGRLVTIKMHQEILGKQVSGYEIDHINGNQLDNRKCNLRITTHHQNTFNCKKRIAPIPGVNPSKYKGVAWRNDRNKWRSTITYNGYRYYLGLYEKEEEAALAYNKAAVNYYGEFARLNKIEGGQ